jgi:lipopolysaccharide transport system permease protein
MSEDKRRWTKVIRPASFSPRVISAGLRDLLEYRDLLFTLTIHRIKVRYKQSLLGIGWAVLQPVLLMAIYTVVFSRLAKMPSEGAPYALFVYAALLPWTFFATSITTASTSLVGHNSLITKVYFPREILPLTYVLASVFDFVVASFVLLILLIAYHVGIGASLLLVFPVMLVAIVFSMAVSLFLAAFQVRFRDVGIAMPLVMQLWMYATPVVYPLAVVPSSFQTLYGLNPMAGVVENFRTIVLQHGALDAGILVTGVIVSCLLLPVAYLYFKTAEATIADVI